MNHVHKVPLIKHNRTVNHTLAQRSVTHDFAVASVRQ